MKVNIGSKTHSVTFETLAVKPKYGKNKNTKVLVKTECSINPDVVMADIIRGSATQNYRDELNWDQGRRQALTRAVKVFNKENRTKFWKEYEKEYPIKG